MAELVLGGRELLEAGLAELALLLALLRLLLGLLPRGLGGLQVLAGGVEQLLGVGDRAGRAQRLELLLRLAGLGGGVAGELAGLGQLVVALAQGALQLGARAGDGRLVGGASLVAHLDLERQVSAGGGRLRAGLVALGLEPRHLGAQLGLDLLEFGLERGFELLALGRQARLDLVAFGLQRGLDVGVIEVDLRGAFEQGGGVLQAQALELGGVLRAERVQLIGMLGARFLQLGAGQGARGPLFFEGAARLPGLVIFLGVGLFEQLHGVVALEAHAVALLAGVVELALAGLQLAFERANAGAGVLQRLLHLGELEPHLGAGRRGVVGLAPRLALALFGGGEALA